MCQGQTVPDTTKKNQKLDSRLTEGTRQNSPRTPTSNRFGSQAIRFNNKSIQILPPLVTSGTKNPPLNVSCASCLQEFVGMSFGLMNTRKLENNQSIPPFCCQVIFQYFMKFNLKSLPFIENMPRCYNLDA